MEENRIALRSGRELIVRCLEPPLPARWAGPFAKVVMGALAEEFLPDLVRGRWSEHGAFRMAFGELDELVAGTGWMGRRRSLPELGVIGGVVTRAAWRREGIGTILCATLCEAFEQSGGRLLYLAAANPGAQRVYERLGFEHVVGQILCRRFGDARPDEGLAPGQPVRARDATHGDLAAIVPLYVHPHECMLVDAGIRMPSSRIAGPARCVGIFWQTWQSVSKPAARWQVLENERGWVVASALARPKAGERATEPGSFMVEFLWHPNCERESLAFVREFVGTVERETGGTSEMLVCEEDDWKLAHARRLGFARERPGGVIELSGKRRKLVTLSRRGK